MYHFWLAALLLITLAGCSNPSAPAPSTTSPAVVTPAGAVVVYTCPMHPEVTSDKPGKCPKCNMDLVVKK